MAVCFAPEKGQPIQEGEMRRVIYEGMPKHKDPFTKGDLYIQFKVLFPTNGFAKPSDLAILEKVLPSANGVVPSRKPASNYVLQALAPSDNGTNPFDVQNSTTEDEQEEENGAEYEDEEVEVCNNLKNHKKILMYISLVNIFQIQCILSSCRRIKKNRGPSVRSSNKLLSKFSCTHLEFDTMWLSLRCLRYCFYLDYGLRMPFFYRKSPS